MDDKMKHFRICIHTNDPKAYEVVEEIAKRIRDEIENGSPKGTSGHGYYVEAEQYDDYFRYPMVGNDVVDEDIEDDEPLSVVLTPEDMEDLETGSTINVMADDSSEIVVAITSDEARKLEAGGAIEREIFHARRGEDVGYKITYNPPEPTDDEIYNRPGMEGGIGYDMNDNRNEDEV